MWKLPLLFLLLLQQLTAQTTINIALIDDDEPDNALEVQFTNGIKDEILQLLQHRHTIHFNTYYGSQNEELSKVYAQAYVENDIIIALGATSSDYAINSKTYPKPTIGTFVLDAKLQGLKKTDHGTSGTHNFTYLESPFNIERDLNLLYQIYPYDRLEVLVEQSSIGDKAFFQELIASFLTGKNVTVDHIFYGADLNEHFKEKEDHKVAIYLLPYLGSDPNQVRNIFQIINENKIPSAALLGEEYIDAGALATHETGDNIRKIPRRIALTVMKIVEGQTLADISVEMQSFSENLIINMETARQIGIYPDFDLMSNATLINLENIQTDNRLNLQQAIAIALKSNLSIKIGQSDVGIADTEIGIAKADLLPQVNVGTNLVLQDETSTLFRQGAEGRANWKASGDFSQTILAEPALANVAIQKMLKESEEKRLLQTQLDVVIDVATAYMNILFAKSNLDIQLQNVERNKENFDVSKTKEAIGYVGASDINRWEAELANSNIELNNAYAGLRQAKFQLNQLLNHPIDEPIEVEDATLEASMLIITENRLESLNNYGALDKFSDFLVEFASKHLPELAQVDLGIRAQERLQLSRQRALFLPSIVASGSAGRTIARFNIPEGLPEPDLATAWTIGLSAQYPIFQGNKRKKLIEQSNLNIIQLQDTRKNTQNQLELLIRSNLETVGASFSRMALSRSAAEASQKNYEIIQDAYSAGQSNVTTLIDAQNNALATGLTASNAIYTFILDFLYLERSIGYYNFLATPAEKDAFFQQAEQHLNQK